MKKILVGLFLVAFSALMLNVTEANSQSVSSADQLPANCSAYSDGCNTCAKTSNGQRACTLMACANTPTTYTCTRFDTGAVITEGNLTNGTVSPEYQTSCKAGLSTINPRAEGMVGGGMLCYDASKGEPTCKTVNAKEGRYYSNGALLREMSCPTTKEPVACTMEYAPVCGSYKPKMICDGTEPCYAVDAVLETYSNKCMMNAAGAEFQYNGECNAPVEETGKVCTKEYMPVCGAVRVECIQAPCPPIPETFGNKCMMEANPRATLLYAGECKGDLKVGEGYAYSTVATILDQSYLARRFTPIQAANYTQSIIDKIDNKLKVSKMQMRAYNKHIQLKRFLELYITLGQK